MINLTKTFTLIVIIFLVAKISTFAQKPNEENKIRSIVALYEKALNDNSVEGIRQLFAEDGILMLQGSPTHIGNEKIRNFYTSLFKNLDFDLKFNIDEVVQMSAEWAFIRTKTSGTVNILSNNSRNPGNGHELFVMKKQSDGNWKIARYAGSSSK